MSGPTSKNLYTLKYQNEYFLIISKLHNIPFHKGTLPVGLVETIRKDLALTELFPVHRLDTMTSGLIMFAKTRAAASQLSTLFRERRIEKYYLALAPGIPKKKQGTIKGDMKKGRNGIWILTRTLNKPAITQFFSAGLGNGLRLYLLKPYSGRTHQLRVMMKSISVPILGDPVYYREKEAFSNIDRGYLHAFILRFSFQEQFFSFIDIPNHGNHFKSDSFIASLSRFSEPWNLPWPAMKTLL